MCCSTVLLKTTKHRDNCTVLRWIITEVVKAGCFQACVSVGFETACFFFFFSFLSSCIYFSCWEPCRIEVYPYPDWKKRLRTVAMPMFLKLLWGGNPRAPGAGTFCVLYILVVPWQCCYSLSTLPLYPSPWCCITKLCGFGPDWKMPLWFWFWRILTSNYRLSFRLAYSLN